MATSPTEKDADTSRAGGYVGIGSVVLILLTGISLGTIFADEANGSNFSPSAFFGGVVATVALLMPAWGLFSLGSKILANVITLRRDLAAAEAESTGTSQPTV